MSFKDVGTGTIGPNYRKTQPGQPDYTGSITFEGRKIMISVWNKRRNDTGQHFYSFSLSEAIPDRVGESVKDLDKGYKKPAGKFDDLEDDIPF